MQPAGHYHPQFHSLSVFHALVLQGTEYTTVCLDGERSTRMLLGASMDRSGSEWVSAHSLEVETLLVGASGLSCILWGSKGGSML